MAIRDRGLVHTDCAAHGRLRGRGFLGGNRVDTFAHFLARLEMRYSLRRNLYRLAGLGIAPDTRRTMMQCKTADSADFDTLIARPHIDDLIQNEFPGKLPILLPQIPYYGIT